MCQPPQRGHFLTRSHFHKLRCLAPQLDFVRIKDRKSTRLNSSHGYISYAVFCLKKKNNTTASHTPNPTPVTWNANTTQVETTTPRSTTTHVPFQGDTPQVAPRRELMRHAAQPAA